MAALKANGTKGGVCVTSEMIYFVVLYWYGAVGGLWSLRLQQTGNTPFNKGKKSFFCTLH